MGMYGDPLAPTFALDSAIVTTEDERQAARAYIRSRCDADLAEEWFAALGLEET
jgi:hypothetical protein